MKYRAGNGTAVSGAGIMDTALPIGVNKQLKRIHRLLFTVEARSPLAPLKKACHYQHILKWN
ncbi:hypothetical protein QUB63_34150 [Microcoleus sp. ARI1-B5]